MAKRNRPQDVAFDENAQVEVTEQELEEGKKKKKREPSKRTLLRNQILEFVTTNVDKLPKELATLVSELNTLPSGVGRGEGKPSRQATMRTMLIESKKVHEDKFYEQFKIGRLECKRIMYNLRKKVAKPEDAIYVTFDPENGMYELAGQGENPPDGFDS